MTATAQEQVDQFRNVIDDKGLGAGAKFLKKIFDPQNLSLMLPLMLMRTDKERSDDEMRLVIETIEKYPRASRLNIILSNLNLICINSGWFLRRLLKRMLNVDEANEQLVAAFKQQAPVRVNQCVVDLFQSMKNDPTHVEALDQIMATFQVVEDTTAISDVQQTKKTPSTKSLRKLSSAEKKVEELRKIIDDKGLEEGYEHLQEMLDLKDPSMIMPLMLMREYGQYNSRHDEMWTVVHAIEGYPKEALVSTIIDNLNVLAEKSSELLDLMLVRISNTTPYRKYLLEYLKTHLPSTVEPEVFEVLEKSRDSLKEKKARFDFFEKVIQLLKGRGGKKKK